MKIRPSRTCGLALAAGALALAAIGAPAFAQPSPEVMAARIKAMQETPVGIHPLRGGAYWVSGGVSNTGFIVGDAGVIAIDPQMFDVTAHKEQDAIAKITPKPVNVMILTHADPDHVNGLSAWPHGIQVIAHENAAAEIKAYLGHPNPADNPPPPAVKDYLPTHTVRFSEDLTLDGVRLRLIHLGAAHTDGDLAIYLPAQKIVFAGDLVTPNTGLYPAIHGIASGPVFGAGGALNKHGSSLGWIRAMKAILALDADTYVSGHGDMLSKAELQKRLVDTQARRDEIKAMFDKGMTLDQIKAALHDPIPTGDAALFPSFTETTYLELSQE